MTSGISPRKARQLIWMCAAFQFCMGMHSALKGIVLPMIIQEYQISYTLSGFLLTASTAGYLVGSILCEELGARIGRKQVLVLVMMVLCATSVLVALTGEVLLYILLFLISGVCYGSVECLTTAVIQAWFPGDADARISAAFSAYCPGAAVGAVLSGLFWLGDLKWQYGYWCCCVFCLACAVVCARIQAPDDCGEAAKSYSLRGIGGLLRYPLFLVGCVAMMLFSGAENASYSWLPTFFSDGAARNFFETCMLSVELYAAICIGRLVFARITRRINGSVVAIITCFTAMAVLACIGLMRSYYVAVAVLGFAMSAIYPLLISAVSRLCSHPLTYTVLFLAVGLGNMTVNSSMGSIADHFGVGGSLRFCGVLLLLVALLMILINKRRKVRGGHAD